MSSPVGNESGCSSICNSVLSCPVCYEEGAQLDLRVLICGHLLCCPCAMRLAMRSASVSSSNSRTIVCPLCRSSQISHVGGNLILAQLPIALKEVLANRAQKQKCNQCESRLKRDYFMHCKSCVTMICGKCAFWSHRACEGVVDYNDFAKDQCNGFKPRLDAMSADSNQLHDQIKSVETYYTEMASIARSYAKMLAPVATGSARMSHGDSTITTEISAVVKKLDDFKEASWPPSSLNTHEVRINQISLKLESIKPAVADFLTVHQAAKDKDQELTHSIRQHFHSIRNGRDDNQGPGQPDAPVPTDRSAGAGTASNTVQEASMVAMSSADDIPNYQPSGSGVRLRMAYSPTRPSLSALRDTAEEGIVTRSARRSSMSPMFQIRGASSAIAPASPSTDDLEIREFFPLRNGIFQSNNDDEEDTVNLFEMETDNPGASPIPADDLDEDLIAPSPTSPTNSIGFASHFNAAVDGDTSPGWSSPIISRVLRSPIEPNPVVVLNNYSSSEVPFRPLLGPPWSSPVVSSPIVHGHRDIGDELSLADAHTRERRGDRSGSRKSPPMSNRSFEREFAHFRQAAAFSSSSSRIDIGPFWSPDGTSTAQLTSSTSSTQPVVPEGSNTIGRTDAITVLDNGDNVGSASPIIDSRPQRRQEASVSGDTSAGRASSSSRRRIVELENERRRTRENTVQFAMKKSRKQ